MTKRDHPSSRNSDSRVAAGVHNGNARRAKVWDPFLEILEQAEPFDLPAQAPPRHEKHLLHGDFWDILAQAPQAESIANEFRIVRPAETPQPAPVAPPSAGTSERKRSTTDIRPVAVVARQQPVAVPIVKVESRVQVPRPEKVNSDPQELTAAQQELIDELDAFMYDN